MINREKFEFIKDKYGLHASWAVWAEETDRPRSNMGDLSIFDDNSILEQLKPNIVLVAYNFSVDGKVLRNWENFHGENGEVYKLRYALKGTKLWGAYMTDIIKDCVESKAKLVTKYLKENQEIIDKNLKRFEEEIDDLQVKNPILYALGNDVFEILNNYLSHKYEINKITHYGWHRPQEPYKERLLSQL